MKDKAKATPEVPKATPKVISKPDKKVAQVNKKADPKPKKPKTKAELQKEEFYASVTWRTSDSSTGGIWHWNVNGLRKRIELGELDKFMQLAKPDVLCLNETKLTEVALRKEGIKDKLS